MRIVKWSLDRDAPGRPPPWSGRLVSLGVHPSACPRGSARRRRGVRTRPSSRVFLSLDAPLQALALVDRAVEVLG